jgi:hypothetical protein
MKLILTKSECKLNNATRITSGKQIKEQSREMVSADRISEADKIIGDVLFSRMLLSQQVRERSIKSGDLFILHNCSLYSTHKYSHVSQQ